MPRWLYLFFLINLFGIPLSIHGFIEQSIQDPEAWNKFPPFSSFLAFTIYIIGIPINLWLFVHSLLYDSRELNRLYKASKRSPLTLIYLPLIILTLQWLLHSETLLAIIGYQKLQYGIYNSKLLFEFLIFPFSVLNLFVLSENHKLIVRKKILFTIFSIICISSLFSLIDISIIISNFLNHNGILSRY